MPAKAEEEPETLAAALVAAAIDRACKAAGPAPVVAPEPAPVVYSELARVGQRVNIDGYFGVVWKVTKKHVAVAYDDESWQHMSHAIFSNRVFKELSFSVETALTGVLQTQEGIVLPTAFLYGVTSSADGLWQMYERYRPARTAKQFGTQPLQFPLTHGVLTVTVLNCVDH